MSRFHDTCICDRVSAFGAVAGRGIDVGPSNPQFDGPGWDDLCMAERILRALRASCYSDLHAVAAIVVDGNLILQGEVSSFFIKQIAQEVVRPVLGSKKLVNELRVVKSDNDRLT